MEKITDKIASLPKDGEFFSLEFFPPKTQMGSSNLQARLERMARGLRPLFVNVTWGAGGSTASKSLELVEICQRQLGLTTCLHLTCTNMSRALIDETLQEAKALGVRNILALRGDAPRSEEYRDEDAIDDSDDSNKDFSWAVDLVRYVRKQHGEYFCIGVASYPEGHSDQSHPENQDTDHDIPFLIEKVKAGADFIMTQLFYDVDAYLKFEQKLRNHSSELLQNIPIIPGLMPIQNYQILRRTTHLSHAKLPDHISSKLEPLRNDDEAVKDIGVDILCDIIDRIKKEKSSGPRGFHFYTLNLEKAVAHIVERCNLIGASTTASENNISSSDCAIYYDESSQVPAMGSNGATSRRLSSAANSTPYNRVVVNKPSTSSNRSLEAPEDEAGVPKDKINSRAHTLAISEGEGSLGREATWDDYPNGRWGDARSPAFGEIDGYGVSLHVSIAQAVKLWDHPTSVKDICAIFHRYISGELDAIPWSEGEMSSETSTIRKELLAMNDKGWWTVASQPAVNGVKSTHSVFGWGPKNGFVFQKAFVEFFLPSSDWKALQSKLEKEEDVIYFAGNHLEDFVSSDEDSVNPVTWGTFLGKEILTPTIIEAMSFRAWLDEAYTIWREWQRIYPAKSQTSQLLKDLHDDVWLVNVIHNRYVDDRVLWDLLLKD